VTWRIKLGIMMSIYTYHITRSIKSTSINVQCFYLVIIYVAKLIKIKYYIHVYVMYIVIMTKIDYLGPVIVPCLVCMYFPFSHILNTVHGMLLFFYFFIKTIHPFKLNLKGGLNTRILLRAYIYIYIYIYIQFI